MKFWKRIFSSVTSSVLAAGAFAALPAAQVNAAESYQNIVILGDSISSGYMLKSGESGYYDYLADCTGGSVTNYAVTGHEMDDLLNVLADSSKQPAIQQADLICISIGSNDLLHPARNWLESIQKPGEDYMTTFRRLAAEGEVDTYIAQLTKATRTARSTASEKYKNIETKLRALNPDAVIVMQTLYNPLELSPETLKAHQISDDNMNNYQKLKNYIYNTENVLNKAMKSLSSVKIADVGGAFADTGWLYIRQDEKDVHPNALGHALIAATVMDTLGNVTGKSAKMTNVLNSVTEELPEDDAKAMRAYAGAVVTETLGDLDGKNGVTADDAQLALMAYLNQLSSGSSGLSAEKFAIADVDKNSILSADDAQYILIYATQKLAGLNPEWSKIIN